MKSTATSFNALTGLAAMTALTIAAAAADTNGKLDGPAIEALLSGATMTGTTARGARYVGRSMADGSMTGSVSNGKHTDRGVWDVSGDRYCRQWENWRNATRSCFQVEDVGGGEYRFIEDGGRGTSTWRIVKG